MIKLFILFVAIILSSCATKIYDYQLHCGKDKEQIVSQFIRLVTSEGLQVKAQDVSIGFVQAESIQQRNIWSGNLMQNFWTMSIKDNIITMSAYTNVTYTNAFGTPTATSQIFMNEDSYKDEGWFWNVRDGMQDLCGGEYQIILRQNNGRKRN